MQVMHLSEQEAINIAIQWSLCVEGKAHEYEPLWKFIKAMSRTFNLKWREDLGHFQRSV